MKQQVGSSLVVVLVLLCALAGLSLVAYEFSLQALQTSAALLRQQQHLAQAEQCLFKSSQLKKAYNPLILNPIFKSALWWQQHAKQCQPGIWFYKQRVNTNTIIISVFYPPALNLQASYQQIKNQNKRSAWARNS